MTASGSSLQERISTGVPGLDTVLCGGFRRGRMYMVMGMPGGGKTILANQTCFHHIRHGGRVLYVTLLAESHTELVHNLHSLSFFDSAHIPEGITYVSGFTALEEGGLEALLEVVRKEIKLRGTTLLVLDGLVAAEEAAPSPRALKKFIHNLQVVTGLLDCTTLVLTTGGGKGLRAEHTMVDGLIVLKQRTWGARTVRELSVRKFRGSAHLLGRHGFEITSDGLVVYPRLETRVAASRPLPAERQERRTFGIASLDAMLQGGLPSGSTTFLYGPPGSGKTLLGLHFLSQGARREELSHYFAFYDSPPRLIAQARGVGMELLPLLERGSLELSFRPPVENLLDKLGDELLRLVRERGVRRLFLDGYEALRRASHQHDRVGHFLAALVNECRERDVTLIFSSETPVAFGPEVSFPLRGLSMVAENILYLRSVELRARMRRFLCVLKMRNSGYDPALRELFIGERGMELGQVLEEGEQLLTGLARIPPNRGL